jgi:hypothetical protein
MLRKGKKLIFFPKERSYMIVYTTFDTGSLKLDINMHG